MLSAAFVGIAMYPQLPVISCHEGTGNHCLPFVLKAFPDHSHPQTRLQWDIIYIQGLEAKEAIIDSDGMHYSSAAFHYEANDPLSSPIVDE